MGVIRRSISSIAADVAADADAVADVSFVRFGAEVYVITEADVAADVFSPRLRDDSLAARNLGSI